MNCIKVKAQKSYYKFNKIYFYTKKTAIKINCNKITTKCRLTRRMSRLPEHRQKEGLLDGRQKPLSPSPFDLPIRPQSHRQGPALAPKYPQVTPPSQRHCTLRTEAQSFPQPVQLERNLQRTSLLDQSLGCHMLGFGPRLPFRSRRQRPGNGCQETQEIPAERHVHPGLLVGSQEEQVGEGGTPQATTLERKTPRGSEAPQDLQFGNGRRTLLERGRRKVPSWQSG